MSTTLVLAALPAVAQFNGPASPTASPEINRPVTLTTDRTTLYPPTHDVLLTAGDMIGIHIFGQSDYSPSIRIGTDGNVVLPLIGEVHMEGLTITEAERLIAQKLVDAGIYRNPQVTLQITEGPNAVATVIGEAHGIVPIIGTRRLLDVLTSVGGLPPTASHVITIHRPGQPEPIVVNLGSDPMHSQVADIPIFAGDTIIISRIGVVYMIGAFKTPGVIALTPYTPLTLMQATALSGGITFEGKYDDLRVIRTVGGERTIVKLDVKRVLYGKAPDPILQPNDIVFLPNSMLKASISNGSLGTLLGVASVLITVITLR
ncbi:polysaccharide export protein [Granulicella sp. 5B5]|uniref:polysaccharide biosynthesis/export family protein n=1 Tax=Granulicella sp. 5B5 TaxID=1617967 RepID=UPI0015F58962|nr:polysaccharide biosynthesis/export family protein [Granulicella sp. 5B5]QMV19567.1 polysaccharide export protein [Granulicella sp. 5B5]